MTSHLKIVSRETSEKQIQRGTKIMNRYGKDGWVTSFTPGAEPIHDFAGVGAVFSGGGQAHIIYEDLSKTITPEAMLTGNHCHVYYDEVMGEEELKALEKAADEKLEADHREEQERRNNREELIAEGRKQLERVMPPWAKAVIVATLDENDCDSMTDYFNVKHGALHLLAWSKHNRDLFPEMRKGAANFEETAHLATPSRFDRSNEEKTEDNKKWWSPRDEHREKYSMGAGYYLKDGGAYSSGWSVKKREIEYYTDEICLAIAQGRIHIPMPEETATYREKDGQYLQVKSVTVSRNLEKEGIEIRFPQKPDPDVRDQLKAKGFRWSRFSGCWYKKYSDEVMAFANSLQ